VGGGALSCCCWSTLITPLGCEFSGGGWGVGWQHIDHTKPKVRLGGVLRVGMGVWRGALSCCVWSPR
jgi:hypothetical protein